MNMLRYFLLAFIIITTVLCDSALGNSDQASYRLMVKQQNLNKINSHNNKPNKSYTMKLYSMFQDKTFVEIQELFLTKDLFSFAQFPRPRVSSFSPIFKQRLSNSGVSGNLKLNWTEKGKVSAVKNQGQCGSCYAYTALADIESTYLIKFNMSLTLSTQQIVECSQRFGNQGCKGGWMMYVFDYVKIRGVQLESAYPTSPSTFQNGTIGACKTKRGQYRIKSYRYTSIQSFDCLAMLQTLLQRPVTVAITADINFALYQSGVLNECGSDVVNHAVQLTGVSMVGSQTRYWLAKNSWSVNWGQLGYIRISLDALDGNLCNICLAPSYSLL